jgi:hypothetical protein
MVCVLKFLEVTLSIAKQWMILDRHRLKAHLTPFSTGEFHDRFAVSTINGGSTLALFSG